MARGESSRKSGGWFHRFVIGSALALLLPFGVSAAVAGSAHAAPDLDGFDFWVESASMGPIKSRVFRAADGNTDRVVYALDGGRAQEDLSGWEINTEVARQFTAADINVVMPIGGQASFYADWNAPSSFLDQPAGSATGSAAGSSSGSVALQVFSGGPAKGYRYTWETFLSQDLRTALRQRLGFNPNRNGVFGLSMSGSSALELAAYHPDQFSYAGPFSGYLNISAPGMREAIRAAMIDAGGYNVDSMAPPWSSQWLRMDPFVFAPLLKADGTRLWIATDPGIPTGDPVAFSTLDGMALEALALANTRAFQARADSIGLTDATYNFPAVGIHNWSNWAGQAAQMLPDLSRNIGWGRISVARMAKFSATFSSRCTKH
ncbi:alpha/beta hydrolase [Nocardia seriolae]|uniref:Diacylglycerol O-acyltransferase n=1 Tax=Nocardia seriolae TaxID=37332 RepID=A0ABC8AZP7_9NOCA|nr:alpha/beta hydrolase family protein [Nocardia seriolae]APA99252.1 Diacylglycerol O-acyltransferase [Nocardia seriolae]OJF80961.1 mycolyltransferase [Nocardia seriolae]PSK32887.1 esterase family protein [Nocardia seriolae]QOW35069.1 esterase family protein [Nocardia seriolae]QUN17466.1 esterase family protein [Nocardia seriolae]